MIPKIIHYCWFGESDIPEKAVKCIASWKKHCPNYEIREWNDKNFPLDACPQYVRDARKAKKYAFVTDYVRLKVLYDYGGFYMDTDVELLKPLDPLCDNQALIGFENDNYVNSGQMLASKAGHPVLQEMMSQYHNVSFYHPDGNINLIVCTHVNTDVLISHGLVQNGREQTVAEVHVYPAEWFNPLDSTTNELSKTANTISVHWYSMSWIPKWRQYRVRLLRVVRRYLKKLKMIK